MTQIPKRVRIVSDGTLEGTRVTAADTGKEIACTHVSLEIDPEKGTTAVLTCVACQYDIHAHAHFKCGCKGDQV